jgi:phosphohistidine phosphatase
LLCHAKSSQVQSNIDDIDGPLNNRRCGVSRKIAQFKSEEAFTADPVLCLSTRCARETLDQLSPALIGEPAILFDSAFFRTDACALLYRLRAVSKDVEQVLVIGHNPSNSDLASMIVNGGAREGVNSMTKKFPTAALAIFNLGISWSGVDPDCATLDRLITASDF